jgi:hypothetical protein
VPDLITLVEMDSGTPVTTVTLSWGMASETFLRLFCRAPSIRSQDG